MLGANGLPRRQVPMPSQTPPPQPGMCAGPCESADGKGRSAGITWAVACVLLPSGVLACCSRPVGRGGGTGGFVPSSHCLPTPPGAFSVSDEEGPSEESHSAKTSGPPVLVQKEACGAGDGAWVASGHPWGLGIPPSSCDQPRKQGKAETHGCAWPRGRYP